MLLSSVAMAPQDPGSPSPLGDGADRSFTLGRIERSAAPKIDGDLDDACWADAPEIGPLIQVEPVEFLVPGQRTVVKVLHDETGLYIAVWCFDDNPAGVRARVRERDGRLDPDDRVEFVFDTFGTYDLGYWFQIGAAGSKGDALLGNNGSVFNRSWDTIWYGRSRLTGSGWQAEVSIPFASIAFADGADSWRFNFRRHRRQDNSEYRWANARQGTRFFRLAETGTMTGLGDIERGLGVDVVPYVRFASERERLTDDDWTDEAKAGGEVFVRLTPSVTAVATIFTDFAETENDDRAINLTRFPLFFPEKRDFFLQDASRFEFGSSGGGRSPSLVPFFSRRIGLSPDGEEIPIIAGLKVAGQEGPWGIGFLSVLTDERPPEVLEDKTLTVLRLTRTVGEEGRVGGIVTYGRPTDPGDNTVYGFDWSDRWENVLGDQELRLFAFGLGSQTSGDGGDGSAFGIDAIADGREWDWSAGTLWITDGFNPELGFVRRTGIKNFDGRIEWEPRPDGDGPVRSWRFELEGAAFLDESNSTTDLEFGIVPFGFELQTGDRFSFQIERSYEMLDEGFDIFDGVVVPAGDYWMTRIGASIRTGEGRAVSLDLRAETGGLYDGDSTRLSAEFDWWPAPLVIAGGRYSTTRGDLPGGDFRSQLAEGRLEFQFSPDISLNNLVQWDNESDNLAVQSRFRWIVEPGSDLFLVAQNGWLEGADGVFRPDAQGLTLKFMHTFRF